MDYTLVPGVVLSNRKIAMEKPALTDIAPTILAEFGIAKPGDLKGQSMFRNGNQELSGGHMFGSHKVKIEGELLEKVKQCADACGYESVDEFVIHMLEKEVKKILAPEDGGAAPSKEEVKKRLQGLGYIE